MDGNDGSVHLYLLLSFLSLLSSFYFSLNLYVDVVRKHSTRLTSNGFTTLRINHTST